MKTLKFEELDLIKHRPLLDKYYLHYNTPKANSNDKILKIHLYDSINGFCALAIDDDIIVGVFTAHIMNLGDQQALKFCHRFHVREDYVKYHNYIVNENLERMAYEWVSKVGLEHLPYLMTINEGNERALYGLTRRHFMKIKYLDFFNEYGKNIVKLPHIWLPYLIKEHGVWQYATWVPVNGTPWNPAWRPEKKDIDPTVVETMNRRFPRHEETGGWYYIVN